MFPQLHFWQLPPLLRMILHDLPPAKHQDISGFGCFLTFSDPPAMDSILDTLIS